MANFLRRMDPNHLVMVGADGFFGPHSPHLLPYNPPPHVWPPYGGPRLPAHLAQRHVAAVSSSLPTVRPGDTAAAAVHPHGVGLAGDDLDDRHSADYRGSIGSSLNGGRGAEARWAVGTEARERHSGPALRRHGVTQGGAPASPRAARSGASETASTGSSLQGSRVLFWLDGLRTALEGEGGGDGEGPEQGGGPDGAHQAGGSVGAGEGGGEQEEVGNAGAREQEGADSAVLRLRLPVGGENGRGLGAGAWAGVGAGATTAGAVSPASLAAASGWWGGSGSALGGEPWDALCEGTDFLRNQVG